MGVRGRLNCVDLVLMLLLRNQPGLSYVSSLTTSLGETGSQIMAFQLGEHSWRVEGEGKVSKKHLDLVTDPSADKEAKTTYKSWTIKIRKEDLL